MTPALVLVHLDTLFTEIHKDYAWDAIWDTLNRHAECRLVANVLQGRLVILQVCLHVFSVTQANTLQQQEPHQ